MVDLFAGYPNTDGAFIATAIGTTGPTPGLEWWGRLDEIRFLERLYELDGDVNRGDLEVASGQHTVPGSCAAEVPADQRLRDR